MNWWCGQVNQNGCVFVVHACKRTFVPDVCWAEGALGHPRTSWDIPGHPETHGTTWMSVGLKEPWDISDTWNHLDSQDIPEYPSQESGITLDTSGSNRTRRTLIFTTSIGQLMAITDIYGGGGGGGLETFCGSPPNKLANSLSAWAYSFDCPNFHRGTCTFPSSWPCTICSQVLHLPSPPPHAPPITKHFCDGLERWTEN